jgi:hypothetical protein
MIGLSRNLPKCEEVDADSNNCSVRIYSCRTALKSEAINLIPENNQLYTISNNGKAASEISFKLFGNRSNPNKFELFGVNPWGTEFFCGVFGVDLVFWGLSALVLNDEMTALCMES